MLLRCLWCLCCSARHSHMVPGPANIHVAPDGYIAGEPCTAPVRCLLLSAELLHSCIKTWLLSQILMVANLLVRQQRFPAAGYIQCCPAAPHVFAELISPPLQDDIQSYLQLELLLVHILAPVGQYHEGVLTAVVGLPLHCGHVAEAWHLHNRHISWRPHQPTFPGLKAHRLARLAAHYEGSTVFTTAE